MDINFIYEYEYENVIFPNGIDNTIYENIILQSKLQKVSIDRFFKESFTDHHKVVELSQKYPDTLFNIFYTKNFNENLLNNFTKVSEKLYTFEYDNEIYNINLVHKSNIDNNANNYYLINLFGNEDFLFADTKPYIKNSIEGFNFNDTNPTFNFNNDILELVSNNSLKIIIVTFHEGAVRHGKFFNKLHNACKQSYINPENVFYINADYNLNNQYIKYCNKNKIDKKLNILFTDLLFCHSCERYARNEFELIEDTKKIKNFLLFNRSVFKDHRVWLLSKLNELGILNDSLYSIIFPYDRDLQYGNDDEQGFASFSTKEEFQKNIPNLISIQELGSVKIDDEVDLFLNAPTNDNKKIHYGFIDPFKNTFDFAFLLTYMSIITESNFSTCQVSEKVSKALRYFHPFIVVSGPNYLKMLKEKGFRTFDKYFDETYDTIEDDKERMKAIINLVNSLNDSNKLQKIYLDSKDDLIYNTSHCKTINAIDSNKKLFSNIFNK